MQNPQKPSVLFLEDDADTRELVRFSLEQAGINVISAQTVALAWQAAMENEIDLFLLDGLIPHGDSLMLCSDLRSLEPEKPIVFYSGLAYKADILKGLEAGATAYLTKPYYGDLAEEILRYIHTATQPKSTEPLFLNKETVLETFVGDNVSIRELPASIDGASSTDLSLHYIGPQPVGGARLRNIRAIRTSSGII